MTALGAGLGWLHLLTAMSLVGLLTASFLAGPAQRATAVDWHARVMGWARWLAGLALLTGLAALAHHAAYLTGRGAAALEPGAWLAVLEGSRWGTVWLVRHTLLLVLAAFLLARPREASTADWAALRGQAWLLAAVALGAHAWAGHAAAVEPGALLAALTDALHLLAAGVWLGALVPLGLLLRASARESGADSRPEAVVAVRRFSVVALLAMLALVATGLVNAWLQVGGVPALIGTRHGRLLLLKLLLVLALLPVALASRRLLPALSGEAVSLGRPAMERLARLMAGEWMLGALILAVAGAMVVTAPARHDSPWWPLSFRLSPTLASVPAGGQLRLLLGSQIVVVGLLLAAVGFVVTRRRGATVGAGLIVSAAGLGMVIPPLAVDAYPTTYLRPAVPYEAGSIARGLGLYRQHCAECHGPAGRGDGPRAATSPKPPADLTVAHAAEHTAGDLFWWLSRGIPASGMPAFAPALSEEDRWDLVNFVRALSSAFAARGLDPMAAPGGPRIVAPDLGWSLGPVRGESLRELRGRRAVLLVLFTLPESRERLAAIARRHETLRALGAEVLAVPLGSAEGVIGRIGGSPPIFFPVVTEGAGEIVAAYTLFRRTLAPDGLRADAPLPAHMELLVDRHGYLRGRWIPGGSGEGWADVGALLGVLARLRDEAPVPLPAEHVH